MKLRLYIDEDASRSALVKALRDATIDVVTTLEAQNLSCTDSEQLVWATQNDRAIYTYNMRDFCRLHSIYMTHKMEHSGIVIAERHTNFGFWILDFRLTPQMNPGAWIRGIGADFSPQINLGACIQAILGQSYSIGEQLRGIQNLVASNSVEQMKNQLVFLGNYIRLE